MLNSDSSTAQDDIRPARSGFCNIFWIGCEAGNGCEAAYEALDLFDGSETAHFDNCLALFGIGLYTALG